MKFFTLKDMTVLVQYRKGKPKKRKEKNLHKPVVVGWMLGTDFLHSFNFHVKLHDISPIRLYFPFLINFSNI